MMGKTLSPKGVTIVEDWLRACEILVAEMRDASPDGKAAEIAQVVQDAESQVNEVLEA